jgi:hypothetical protein
MCTLARSAQKLGIVVLWLSSVACSSPNPALPTSSAAGHDTAANAPPDHERAAEPAQDAAGSTERTAAAVPALTVGGPRDPGGCFVASATGPMRWVVNVADAGPSPLRFIALAHHDDERGCQPTVSRPRARVEVSGPAEYPPHAAGQTVFTFNPALYTCGRVQVDVSVFDAVGQETLLVGVMIDYGASCEAPPRLVCTPASPFSPPGVPAVLTASGGTGVYRWSAPGGAPTSGTGKSFTTHYWVIGIYIATVTSGDQTASCESLAIPLTGCNQCILSVCQPYYQYVGINRPVTFAPRTVTGVPTFTWTAPAGSPSSGSGVAGGTFTTTFTTPGFYEVTVQAGATAGRCTVSAVPPEYAPSSR